VLFARASVRFWVEQEILTRFEQFLDASLDFNGSEFVVERTTTTTIKDVGSAEVKLPEKAAAALGLAGSSE
jgi:hypothetical protein